MSAFLRDVERYMHDGGFVMWPLVIGAIVLWMALGYRALLLRRGRLRSAASLVRAWREGERFAPLGIIDLAVIRGMAILDQHPVEPGRHLEDAFFDIERRIGRFSVLIQALVAAAPLAGLFGTVTGMMETFSALGDSTLFSQSGGIAGGIAAALITTQMGLSVAIPGLVVGRILRRRQGRIQEELDELRVVLCLMSKRQEPVA
jgi:biopolymer transport protein ExbB